MAKISNAIVLLLKEKKEHFELACLSVIGLADSPIKNLDIYEDSS
jgi:hypothetical protein